LWAACEFIQLHTRCLYDVLTVVQPVLAELGAVPGSSGRDPRNQFANEAHAESLR